MSLDSARLENVRELTGGIVQARCPACAEGGHDRTGEHLRIYPDGRFGCCVHPKDKQHRKRIFALVGVRNKGTFTLRVKTPVTLTAVRSVKAALTTFNSGTLGTPKTELENGVRAVRSFPVTDFGTLGTVNSELRARARVDSTVHVDIGGDFLEKLKDSECAVPIVPSLVAVSTPYLMADGTLVIPFSSPERYHWWKGGQTIGETLAEVRGGLATKRRITDAVSI